VLGIHSNSRNSRRPCSGTFQRDVHEQVYNEPLRGQAKELQEQAKSQRILLEDTRNSVISRTAAAYLELGMVRHSLDLLRQEQSERGQILEVTRQREKENFELPVEVTRSQLTKPGWCSEFCSSKGARRTRSVSAKPDGAGAGYARSRLTPEDLRRSGARRRKSGWPWRCRATLPCWWTNPTCARKNIVSEAKNAATIPRFNWSRFTSLLGKFNNYDQFFKTFERNNLNAGVQVSVPIFSAQTKANIALAEVNLHIAQTPIWPTGRTK